MSMEMHTYLAKRPKHKQVITPTKMSIMTRQMITSVIIWLPFRTAGGWDIAGMTGGGV